MITLSLDYEAFETKPKDPNLLKFLSARIGKKKRIVTITEKKFAKELEEGKTWTAVFNDGRRADKWEEQQLFAADLDEGQVTPEMAEEICERHCIEPFIIHHSFSSTPEKVKLRIIFKTEEPIRDPYLALQIQTKLKIIFDGDPAVKDIARIYYGSQKNGITYFDKDAILDLEELEPLPDLQLKDSSSIDEEEREHADESDQMKVLRMLNREHPGRFKLIIQVIKEQEQRVRNVEEQSGYMSVFRAALRLSQFHELYANNIIDSITGWVDTTDEYKGWQHRNQLCAIIKKGISFGRRHLYDT